MDYDLRYLEGVVLFNNQEYFLAHEAWEEVWQEGPADRRFYQSLIQAAVALYHAGNGNAVGAGKLQKSGRAYMEPFTPRHQGLDVLSFWAGVDARLASDSAPAPTITLDPPPNSWPAVRQSHP
jgi:predicted metal-dependent hydrolase